MERASEEAKYNRRTMTDDQKFLLLFIIGTYFGPDLKENKPKKSALQRIAEGLPKYTFENLARTQMKTCMTERVYYYVLRMANPAVLVKLPLLRQFVKGNLFTEAHDPSTDHDQYRQFTDIFPTNLHLQSRFRDRYKTVDNIVFIDNPDISYIKPEDMERFKSLTGLDNLVLDRVAAINASVGVGNTPPSLSSKSSTSQKRKQVNYDHVERPAPPPMSSRRRSAYLPAPPLNIVPLGRVGAAILLLPEYPTTEEWNTIVAATRNGIELVGTAAARQSGPLVGLVDVGVSDHSYLFRVALPGVKRNENDFSCKVEPEGRVVIGGVTKTGQRYIYRYNQIFYMRTRYLCPPGAFTISFQLPGPVKACELIANFGRGILEGVVRKA